jgi:hypothetical protein
MLAEAPHKRGKIVLSRLESLDRSEYRNAAIVGARYGTILPCPFCDQVLIRVAQVEKGDRRVGISLIDRPMRVTIDLQHRDTIRQHPPRH